MMNNLTSLQYDSKQIQQQQLLQYYDRQRELELRQLIDMIPSIPSSINNSMNGSSSGNNSMNFAYSDMSHSSSTTPHIPPSSPPRLSSSTTTTTTNRRISPIRRPIQQQNNKTDQKEHVEFAPLKTNGPSPSSTSQTSINTSAVSSGNKTSPLETTTLSSHMEEIHPFSDQNSLYHLNSQLKRSYDICARRCRQYEQECDKLREDLYKLKRSNHQLAQEIENMKEEIHLLRSKNGESNGISLDLLRGQLLQHKSIQLEKSLKDKEDIVQKYEHSRSQVERLKKERELNESVESKEMERLIDENSNSTTMLKTRSLENNKLREELQTLRSKMARNDQLMHEREEKIAQLQKRCEDHETRSKQNSEYSEKVKQIKEQIEMEKQRVLAQKDVEMEELKSTLAKKHEANLRYLSQQQLHFKQQMETEMAELQQQLSAKKSEVEEVKRQRNDDLKKLREQMTADKEKQIQIASDRRTQEKEKLIETLRKKILELEQNTVSSSFNDKMYEQLNNRLNMELNEERKKVQSLYQVQSENSKLKDIMDQMKEKQITRNKKFEALKKKNIYLVNGCDSLKKRNRYLEELNKRLVEKVVHKEDLEKSLNAQLELLNQQHSHLFSTSHLDDSSFGT